MSRSSSFVLLAAIALSLGACGGAIAGDPADDADSGPIAPGHGTFTDGGTGKPLPQPVDASPNPSGLVFSDDTTIVLALDGGFSAQGQDTTACIVEHEVYAYDFSNGGLKWEVCVIADGGARNELVSGSVTLSSPQKDALDSALANLRIVGIVSTCGSDLPDETLEVSSPEQFAPEIYYDQFTRCGDHTITHVTGLGAVHEALAGDAR